MGIKQALVGAGLATTVLGHAHHLNKRATLPFDGTIYTQCVTPGEIAITFDDGPFDYTQKIVDDLTASGNKVTFFQNGQNYGNIYSYGPLLTSIIAGGHQIGSHTWSHADLATLTAEQITEELGQLATAHLSLIGKSPTYLRPPYLSTNDLAIKTVTALGYHIVSVDIDTFDYNEGPAGRIQNSIDWFEGNFTAGGSISLNHDPYEQTADVFVPAIIKFLAAKGLKSVTVGTCLGDDEANWYKTGPIPSASVSASASASGSIVPSASGNGTISKSSSVPYPSGHGTYPNGNPLPSSGAKPGKPCGGGDTEPGHGPDAGRGALPGHKGQGNDGWTGSYGTATNSSGAAATTGSVVKPSSVYTGPLSNGANALTGSILALGAAAVVALFL